MRVAVRRFPDRKKPCLMIESGNAGLLVASFRNEDMARLFEILLGTIVVDDKRTIDEMLEEVNVDGVREVSED